MTVAAYHVYGQPFTSNEMYKRMVALFDLGIGRLVVVPFSPLWMHRAKRRHDRRTHYHWINVARKERSESQREVTR